MKKFLTTILFAFTLMSCGQKQESLPQERVLNYNGISEGSSFDPQILFDGSSLNIHGFLSRGLTYTTSEGEIKPAMAESWEVSPDGKTWTFHLRDDAKWSNGEKITAKDFEYGWLRALDPEVASEYAYIMFPIKNAENYTLGKAKKEEVGVKALDDKTLQVQLENVTPYFGFLTSFITFMPANEEFIKAQNGQYALEADKLLYTGPYMIKDWKHNESMKLVKNPYYYNPEEGQFDEVNIKFIVDPNAQLNAFKNEELDISALTELQYLEFKDDPNVVKSPLGRTIYLTYNLNNSFMNNPNIRRAISLAIDKPELVSAVLNNVKDVLYTFTPKNVGINTPTGDYAVELGEVFEKENPEKARELYQKGLQELGLETAPQIVLLADERGNNKKIAEHIQENLRKNLGLNVKVDVVTLKERIQRTNRKDYDIALIAWGADYPDPMTFLDLFTSTSTNNTPGYHLKEYDDLIIKAKNSTNSKERMKYLMQAEKVLARDLPILPLYQETQLHIIQPNLKNVKFGSFGIFNDFSEAYKENK